MDEHYNSRLLSRLQKSYADRNDTLTWALIIWSFTAIGFAIFFPFEGTIIRSIGVTTGWSIIHLVRRM